MNYTFIKTEDGLYGCDSCNYPAPLGQYDTPSVGRPRGAAAVRFLCEICACTHVSNHTHYTDQYPEVHAVTQTIAYCTNAILEGQGKFKTAETVNLPPDQEIPH